MRRQVTSTETEVPSAANNVRCERKEEATKTGWPIEGGNNIPASKLVNRLIWGQLSGVLADSTLNTLEN